MFTICLQFGHTLFTTDLYNVLKDKGKGYLKRVSKVYNMNQFIKLNNETFEVKKVKGELHPIEVVRGLADCYKKPSPVKFNIYNYWLDWCLETNKDNSEIEFKHFSINSYNSRMFTMKTDVYKNGIFIGQLYITRTRQEFWIV